MKIPDTGSSTYKTYCNTECSNLKCDCKGKAFQSNETRQRDVHPINRNQQPHAKSESLEQTPAGLNIRCL